MGALLLAGLALVARSPMAGAAQQADGRGGAASVSPPAVTSTGDADQARVLAAQPADSERPPSVGLAQAGQGDAQPALGAHPLRSLGHNGLPGRWGTDGAFALAPGELSVLLGGSYVQVTDFIVAGDYNAYSALGVNIAWAPLPYVELGLSSTMTSNFNTRHVPDTILVFGDPTLRLRAPFPLSEDLALAVLVAGRFPTAANSQGLALDAPGVEARLAASWAALGRLNLHGNVGVLHDRSLAVVTPEPDALMRFVGRLGSGTSLLLALAVDYAVPIGADSDLSPFAALSAALQGGDEQLAVASAGLAWRNGSFELAAGVDLRLLGAPEADRRLPGLLPFLLGLDLAYHFNRPGAGTGGERVVERVVEKPVVQEVVREVVKEVVRPAPTWTIEGRLVDARSKAPIKRGQVAIKGSPISDLAVQSELGAFRTYGLEPGKPVLLDVAAPGYLPRQLPVAPLPEGVATVAVELQPAGSATGTLKGTIKAMDGQPLAARVFIPQLKQTLTSDAADGAFEGQVAVGSYEVLITAKGYRMQKKTIEIRPGDVMIMNLDLTRGR